MGKDAPLPIVVLQGGEVFDPVPGVEVLNVAFLSDDGAHLGLMDVPADHVVVALLDGYLSSGLLKIADVADGLFDAVFDLFGEGHLLAAQLLQAAVDEAVHQDEQVVAQPAQLGQPLGMHAGVKDVAVKDPGLLIPELEDQLVAELKVAQLEVCKLAQQLIVVAREVVDRGFLGNHLHDLLDHLHVRLGPVPLVELPYVYDVPVEDQHARLYALEVLQQFLGLAPIGAQVNIRDDDDVYFSLATHLLLRF